MNEEEIIPKAASTNLAGDWQFAGTSINGEFTIAQKEDGKFYVTSGVFTVNSNTTSEIIEEKEIGSYISLIGSLTNLSGFKKKVTLDLVDFKLSADYSTITANQYSYSIEDVVSRDVQNSVTVTRK